MAELSFIRIPTIPHPFLNTKFTTHASLTSKNSTSKLSLQSQKQNLPARDTPIDFGKHRGKLLGTLPSTYLRWVSNNLRARHFEHWAKLADEVLSDPVYRDRIEWEFAENVLTGSGSVTYRGDSVSELLEISERFGWDNDDKKGWKDVDFALLGTSKGGRIPRVCVGKVEGGGNVREGKGRVEELGKRKERRERGRKRREGTGFDGSDASGSEERGVSEETGRKSRVSNPFPGREGLFKKVLNRERLT